MFYNQHKFVGDSVIVGKNVSLPAGFKAAGQILFSQKESIENTGREFLNELLSYNTKLKKHDISKLRHMIEHDSLTAEVRRTFGDINGWAGDHAKLNPPDGKSKRFKELKVKLQVVAETCNFDYMSLALKN